MKRDSKRRNGEDKGAKIEKLEEKLERMEQLLTERDEELQILKRYYARLLSRVEKQWFDRAKKLSEKDGA